MDNVVDDVPSMPQIVSVATLHLGITTRVLAKKLAFEREKLKDLEKRAKETGTSGNDISKSKKRSSRFLEGASIPNSVIKAELNTPESPTRNRASIKKERDEFVEKLTNRLQPHKKMYHSIYDEDVDREALNKIKKELQRRSLLPLNRDEADKKSLSIATTTTANSKSTKVDPWEELKEKRRISRRTSILAPLDGERRSTYDSIKKAIQSSKIIQNLLDADNIEEQKIRQLHTGKSLINSAEFKESVAERVAAMQEKLALEPSSSNIKAVKSKGTKDMKPAKRKSSLKSDKSLNLPSSERPSVKIKLSSESRRFSKRSNVKLLKEELGKRSSLIITNTLQPRKNTN